MDTFKTILIASTAIFLFGIGLNANGQSCQRGHRYQTQCNNRYHQQPYVSIHRSRSQYNNRHQQQQRCAAPRPIWIEGYYSKQGCRYVWNPGYYAAPHGGQVWCPAQWQNCRGRWVYIPGRVIYVS